MCGIAGIVDFDGNKANVDWLASMNRIQAHRGPDGANLFVFQNVGLAHTRLAIIDLSVQAAQPFHRDRLVITYNGEIFNFPELKNELIEMGHRFETRSDTEVLLASYQQWGIHCVKRFHGMWSFALYDQKEEILFCSRDRFGEKPFYYTFHENRFVFASTLRAIVEVTGKRKANQRALINYFVQDRCEFFDETFFEGIHKMPASHSGLLDINRRSFQLHKYYEPAKGNELVIHESDAVNQLEKLMKSAIACRLRGDVEVGACLSGGLDSSCLTRVAAELLRKQDGKILKGFTIGSGDEQNDESSFAKAAAEVSGTQWFPEQAAPASWTAWFDDLLQHQEEPFNTTSLFMQYQAMRLAAKKGMKVLLDGQGADETWLGYPVHIAFFLRRMSMANAFRQWPKLMGNNSLHFSQAVSLKHYHAYPFRKYFWRMFHLKPLLQKNAADGVDMKWLKRKEESVLASMRAYQQFELYEGSLSALLRFEDKNAMRFGIETRLPYLDQDMVDFALLLPDHLKISRGWTKFLLRNSAAGKLPAEVVWRKRKVGFEAPNRWLPESMEVIRSRVQESPLLRSIFLHPEKAIQPANAFAMLSVARWQEMFNLEG
jgi:asparagine synthase (glutamine-hydrolysing)